MKTDQIAVLIGALSAIYPLIQLIEHIKFKFGKNRFLLSSKINEPLENKLLRNVIIVSIIMCVLILGTMMLLVDMDKQISTMLLMVSGFIYISLIILFSIDDQKRILDYKNRRRFHILSALLIISNSFYFAFVYSFVIKELNYYLRIEMSDIRIRTFIGITILLLLYIYANTSLLSNRQNKNRKIKFYVTFEGNKKIEICDDILYDGEYCNLINYEKSFKDLKMPITSKVLRIKKDIINSIDTEITN